MLCWTISESISVWCVSLLVVRQPWWKKKQACVDVWWACNVWISIPNAWWLACVQIYNVTAQLNGRVVEEPDPSPPLPLKKLLPKTPALLGFRDAINQRFWILNWIFKVFTEHGKQDLVFELVKCQILKLKNFCKNFLNFQGPPTKKVRKLGCQKFLVTLLP